MREQIAVNWHIRCKILDAQSWAQICTYLAMKLKSFELEPGTLAGKFGIVAVRIYTLEVRQLVIYCDNYVLVDGKLWQEPELE